MPPLKPGPLILSLSLSALPLRQARGQATEAPAKPFLQILAENRLDPSLADGLTHSAIEVRILAADTPREFNYSKHYQEPETPAELCGFQVAHPSFTRAALIHQYTRIPEKYIRPLGGPDLTFPRTLLHEARHCMHYVKDDPLPLEIDADLFAARAIRRLPGGEQDLAVLAHVRAINPLLGQARSHATALSLEALSQGRAGPAWEEVSRAYEALYEDLVAASILDPAVHGVYYEAEGDLVRAVFSHLKERTGLGRYDAQPLAKRAAELFVEGVESLAPALLQAHGLAPVSAPAVEFQSGAGRRALFDWDESRRERVRGVIAETLRRMPLDLAELPPIRGVSVSDADEACSTARCTGTATWSGAEGRVLVSGWAVLVDERERGFLSASIVHELAHAWQERHPARLGEFSALRFDALARNWKGVQRRGADHIDRVVRSCESDCDRAIVRELEANARREAEEYDRLGLPRRPGVETLLKLAEPEGPGLDHHALENPLEYHATLVELLWQDPAAAERHFSPEELAWTRRVTFGGRTWTGPSALGRLEPRLERVRSLTDDFGLLR